MAILWLASFPKSGNTWLRAFLANYMANGAEPVRLEALRSFGYSDAHAWPYEQLAGKPRDRMTEAEILALRPEVHRFLADSRPEHVLVKTHFAMGKAAGVATITEAETHGAVYIVRNPWDVAVSYADHYGVTLEDAATALAQPTHTIRASETNVTQFLGSWSNHVASWHSAAWLKRLTLRYEDIVADPARSFAKVVRFMGLPENDERLIRATGFASFDELQRQEAESGFVEKSRHSEKFFRQGQAGGWREVMPEVLAQQIAEDHAEILKSLGYLSADGTILDR